MYWGQFTKRSRGAAPELKFLEYPIVNVEKKQCAAIICIRKRDREEQG